MIAHQTPTADEADTPIPTFGDATGGSGHPVCRCGHRLNRHWITEVVLARLGVHVTNPCPTVLEDNDWPNTQENP